MIYVYAFALSILLYVLSSLYLRRIHQAETLKEMLSKGDHFDLDSLSDASLGFEGSDFESRPVLPFVLAALPLVLVSGLRYGVGTDYFNTYYTGFYRLLSGYLFDQFEIGYYLLNRAVQFFTDNVFVLFFITSLVVVGFTFAAFRRMSPNVVFSILLFLITRYYFISMNGVRQLMACAVFAYALSFAIKRELKPYLVFTIVAISFHYSAVILLPTYWLMNVSLPPRRAVLLLAVFAVGGGLGYTLLSRILPASSKWGYTLFNTGVAGILFTVGTILLNLFILGVYYLPYREHKDEFQYRCFLYLQVVAVAFTLLLPWIPAVERVYWCFSYPMMISFPVMASYIKPKALGVAASAILIAVFSAYCIYDIGVLNDHEVLPYDTIFRHEPVPSGEWTYREFVTTWTEGNEG